MHGLSDRERPLRDVRTFRNFPLRGIWLRRDGVERRVPGVPRLSDGDQRLFATFAYPGTILKNSNREAESRERFR